MGSTGWTPDANAGQPPLAGVRVADFTTMIAGAYGTRLLADMGAEVIKIESPDGDAMRHRQPVRNGCSTYFGTLNIGKKSVVLNLREPAGRRAALDLTCQCDVVVENFRPGVMRRLNLDFEHLIAAKKDLVYCSISGYGQTGPLAELPAYAPILQAMSGYDLAHLDYQPAVERPASTGIFIADVMAGVIAYGAVLTGLRARDATGHGGYFDITLLETMLALLPFETQNAQRPNPTRKTVYRPVRAGHDFVIIAPISERTFAALGKAIGVPDLIRDPRFATIPERERNWETLWEIVEAWSAPLDTETVMDRLERAGCPCGRYRTIGEVVEDPFLRKRGTLRLAQDDAGEFLVTASPMMSDTWPQQSTAARVPALGQDTDDVLRVIAGYDDARVAQLRPS
jgi:crotonobetainyl-CoA:carnitine CoA-transferase CaiB-like acyl-CoA transferase